MLSEITLGWVDEDAITILDMLGILPSQNPRKSDEQFDPVEYALIDEDYINDVCKSKYHDYLGKLIWKDGQLIWQSLFSKTFGSSDEDPIQLFTINPDIISNSLNEFKKFIRTIEIDLPSPQIHLFYDHTDWYETMYDQDHNTYEQIDEFRKLGIS